MAGAAIDGLSRVIRVARFNRGIGEIDAKRRAERAVSRVAGVCGARR